MEVCILGGTGFIGRHLCCALHAKQIKTMVVSRSPDHEFLRKFSPSVEAYSLGEVCLWDKLRSIKTLVILASGSRPASSWRAPDGEIEHNLLPISAFLQRFIDANRSCHIIYASSGGQIYGNGYNHPISESSAPSPVTAYGLGKLLIEKLLAFFGDIGEINYSILRIANPVGYWQYGIRHGFVTGAISAGLSSTPLVLYGDGHNIRDYFDVDDLCDLICHLAEKKGAENFIFNIGSGRSYTELEVIKSVEKELQRGIIIECRPSREFDLRYAALNVEKVNAVTGWSATTPIETTIQKIICQIKSNTLNSKG
ncbi:NAD-dependent epimerase/dehydratase family protein [Methylorubrum aminovorans]